MAMDNAVSVENDLHTLHLLEETKQSEQPPSKKKELSLCQKVKLVITNISVEPVVFCCILPAVMASLATQNLNLEKACRVNFKFEESVCDALSIRNTSNYTKMQEQEVQRLVTTVVSFKRMIQGLIPSIVMMFLGSWSDRHKRRKPCILLPVVGEAITCVGCLLATYFFYELSVEYTILIEAVPPALAGGWFCMFMGVFSYISERSDEESRTIRIGAVSMFSNISITIGIALSGILYKIVGFYGVFSLALLTFSLGILYGLLMIHDGDEKELKNSKEFKTKDTNDEDVEDEKKRNFILDFFDVKHIKNIFKVAFKEGARNRKKKICSIMFLVMIIIGPGHGEMDVAYLFTRLKFNWDEISFSMYNTFHFLAHMFGTIFSLAFFSKFLKVDDALLGLISCASKVCASLVYALAPNPTVFYIGALVETLNGTSFIAMRSIMSKLVPKEELGQIYSLFGVCEALMPLIYGPLYSIVYNKTMNLYLGSHFIMTAVLTFPAVIMFFWLYKESKRDQKDERLKKEQEEALLRKNSKNEECEKAGYGGTEKQTNGVV